MEQKNKILITGGFGFIGYHLTKFLLDKGHHVIVYGHRSKRTKKLFDSLEVQYSKRVEFIEDEIIDELYNFVHKQPDIVGVFHLAALKTTTRVSAQAGLITENNLTDLEVFSTCEHILSHRGMETDNRQVNLVYVSTCEVYGRAFEWGTALGEGAPCVVSPILPEHSYPLSKIFGEALLNDSGYKFKWNVARLQNPYGPLMDPRTFIPVCLSNIKSGMVTNINSREESRPYVYISDVCEALYRIYMSDSSSKTYNVAGKSITANEVVQTCSDVVGVPANLVNKGDKPVNRNVDCSRIKMVLGWEPTVSLKDGIKRMHDFSKNTEAVDHAMKRLGL